MASFNQVTQIGNLVDDARIQTVGSKGTQMASFRLAVQRSYKDRDGNRPADFHNCVIYGGRVNYLTKAGIGKGTNIFITGELRNDNYTDKKGNKQYGYQINIDQIRRLDSFKNSNSNSQPNNSSNQNNNQQSTNQSNTDPFANESKPISDDDLPF